MNGECITHSHINCQECFPPFDLSVFDSTTAFKRIIKDDRPIIALHLTGSNRVFTIGRSVKAIVPYEENGQMAPVVWFAIIAEDGSARYRIPATDVMTVEY